MIIGATYNNQHMYTFLIRKWDVLITKTRNSLGAEVPPSASLNTNKSSPIIYNYNEAIITEEFLMVYALP